MDIQLYIWPIVVFLGASLVLALPSTKSRGCLVYIVRTIAFLAGSISPLLILWRSPGVAQDALRWQFPGSLLTYLAILVAIMLGACAVTLAAAGLQILLRRGRGDFEDKLDLSWFGLPEFGNSITNNLDVVGCVGIVLFVVLGGLLWFGLALGSSIKDAFTPRDKTRGRRLMQGAQAFVSGLIIFGLSAVSVGLLFFLNQGASTRAATPPNVFIEVPAPGSPNDTKYSVEDLPVRLDEVWRGVEKDTSLSWEPVYTPLFPTEWPPLPGTLWVSYAYASAHNTEVTDAVVVSAPWAIVEYSAGRTPTAKVVPLGNRVEQTGLQGTTPLHAGDGNSLSKQDAVFSYCLTLIAPPDESSSEVSDMHAFYNAWLRLNGRITSLIRPNHLQFLGWVEPR
jgi:hypothetical protein